MPPNVEFIVDDFEGLSYRREFDFIRANGLAGSIQDLDQLIEGALEACSHGGWFEISDWVFIPSNDSSSCYNWWQLMVKAAGKAGINFQTPYDYKRKLEEHGFRNVRQDIRHIPLQSTDNKDDDEELQQKMSKFWTTDLEGFSLSLMSGTLGISMPEVFVYCAAVRKELESRNVPCYWERSGMHW